MINTVYEDDDGNMVHLLDREGIGYLIQGLTELAEQEPGTELVTPSISTGDGGRLESAGYMILLRAEDDA